MPTLLGVDVGGTFTDFVLWHDGRLTIHKLPTTPQDPAQAVLAGLDEMEGRPQALVHGSTIATNAIIEGKGAPTALITSRGFRDVLVIGRQTRPRLYDFSPQRPLPLVPDDLRLEVDERLDHRGHVLTPLDPKQVEELLDQLQRAGAHSLAVCFLFSFLNPDHERLVARRARRRGLFVSPSHEVLPEHREYERTATTVVNAYVAPVVARYLQRLAAGLAQRAVPHLHIIQANGGSLSPQVAARLAVRTALSGPAAGVVGAFHLARQSGYDHIVTLDMGGTSTDVSLCPGQISERDETRIGDLPVRGPTVDVVSVGAGGGSIAYLDEGGALHVGPQSAGADPGPACYGKALHPTVTDAHLVLGRLEPRSFLGGRMALQPDHSFQALASVAAPFEGDPHRTAAAILRVANANMERALRVVSVERGHDPRLFTLIAFGGAGPLHACPLAQSLRIPRVLVPLYPGVLSALGTLVAPPTLDLSAALMLTVPPSPLEGEGRGEGEEEPYQWAQVAGALRSRFAALRRRGLRQLAAEGFPTNGVVLQPYLEMRYQGQSYELSVPLDGVSRDGLSPARFLPRFHQLNRQRYAHAEPSRPVEVVNVRLKLIVPIEAPALPPLPAAGPDPSGALIDRRDVFWDSPRPTAVYDRARLLSGNRLEGPALILQADATTAIPAGWRGQVDPFGNLVLEVS